MFRRFAFGPLVIAGVLAACSSSSSNPATPASDAGSSDASKSDGAATDAGPPSPPGTCFPNPGSVGNSHGVGTYCSAGGGQCSSVASKGAALCAIDADPQGGNFCIQIGCSAHSDCGEKACCTGRAGQSIHACVPQQCVAPDGGDCPPIPGAEDAGSGADAADAADSAG